MNDFSSFGSRLLSKILLVHAGVALPIACGACSDSGGTGGAGGASGSTSASSTHASTTTAQGTSSASTTSASSSGSTTSAASTGSGMTDVERCFAMPVDGCPAVADASTSFGPCTSMSEKVITWLSGPTATATECCYQVDVSDPGDPACGIAGRPFVVGGRARVARIVVSDRAWSDGDAKGRDRARLDGSDFGAVSRISLDGIDDGARARLAKQWAEDAAYEHASIASFGKLAMELLAFGAPAELVRRCHEAALDEVRHAGIGFALASRYAGSIVAPSALPEARSFSGAVSLEALAIAALREGCFGETLAAFVASEQAAAASDPALASIYADIARDEAEHAELAFAVVAWAMARGGESVRARVHLAALEMTEAARTRPAEGDESDLRAHGRFGGRELGALHLRAVDDIVAPALAGSFGAPV